MKTILRNLRNIFWLYRPSWRYGKSFVLLSLLFWLLIVPLNELVNVYLPNFVINALTVGKPFSSIVVGVLCLQGILLAQPLFEDTFNMFCKNRALPRIEIKIKREIYEKSIQTDYKYIDNPAFYDNYSWAINEYAEKAQEAQELVNRAANSLIVAGSMLAIIAAVSPLAIAVTLVSGVLQNGLYAIVNAWDVKRETAVVPWDRRLDYHHRVFYLRDYAADLKSSELPRFIFRQYEQAECAKLGIIQSYACKTILWALSADVIFHATQAFIVLNIARGIYNGDIPSVGAYVTMMLAVNKLTEMANDLFYHAKDANLLGKHAAKIRAFFEAESTIETDTRQKKAPPEGVFSVAFQDAQFQYDKSAFAIDGLNLTVEPGEKLAIVGANGVGKSTLVKLLLRLYDLGGGSIAINGTPLTEYDLPALRRKIGVAFQASNVYAFSLADNLRLYHDADENTLQGILRQLQLDGILEKNNASLDSTLTKEFDEDGIMLSGGEIQKIGIARLLAGDFGLLLLDEPSSALDPLAEYEMSKLILDSSNRATTIIVAHRLSTIRNADRIVLLENGGIAEMGTHDALMAAKGKYCEMFTKQAENYQN